ncbi:MAG: bifunctional (p)ppGpp synthetase/guanosine-3',5'-bis(diphosphate) 3'-pyrophosphohydrolase, partial [Methylococcales bacterium]|nr:bifunctional (p)ppGpp synthetase/guanosine-3',5'-bis(diphosphate) 3'-pyrophosphohydrolase [Methylococcales bacterium]
MAIKPFYVPPDGELLFSEAAEYLPLDDVAQLRAALAFATTHHAGQMRKTGEPYISHPLTVAYYMAQHRRDTVALIAALLHDVAEDTLVSLPEIEARFSKSVSDLVKGVTKFEQKADDIARDGLYTKEQVNERTIFGLLGAMKDDIRGLIIKLFDRLHNLETMGIMSPKSRKRKTYEVFNIYAPLANRFGMWSIKSKLERMSFALENPRMFERVEAQMVQLRRVQEPLFRQVKVDLGRKLQQMGVDVKEIFFTPGNIYNVYQEMQQRGHGNRWFGRELRMVVVVNEKDACYQALGAAHTLYKPVHGKFDDYIALPRDNLYRSLHTTIVHSGGKKVKIRFRTPAMDILSRHGVMSLWLGPHTEGWSEEMAADVNKQIAALLVNIGKNIDDGSEAGVQPFINQFFGPQIGVHTPKGDIIELSVNATPIDFAYRIHTDVGHGCRSAVVNGIPVPLNTRLKNGDQVEIHKVDYGSPPRIWLDEDLEFVHMSSHRSEIRRWFRKLPDNKTVHEGKEILETELAMLGLAEIPHANVAGWLGY